MGRNNVSKEGNDLFNNAFNTFYLRAYGVKDHSDNMKPAATFMGYSFRSAARHRLYAPSHRQDSTYHSHCLTSCGTQVGMRNTSVGPTSESMRLPTAQCVYTLTTEQHPTLNHLMENKLFLIPASAPRLV